MGVTKRALTFLLLTVTLLATRQLALGQSGTTIPEISITVDDKAHGTKVSGTLTIYYEPTGQTPTCPIGVEAIFFFMRLQSVQNSKVQIPFSGDLSGEHICSSENSRQQGAIEDFIRETVIGTLFPDTPFAPFALKSVDQFVIGGNGVTEPLFVMMDFVIAVQEK